MWETKFGKDSARALEALRRTAALFGDEKTQYLFVGARESETVQSRWRTPAPVGNARWISVGEFSAQHVHRNPVARDRMPDLMESFYGGGLRAE